MLLSALAATSVLTACTVTDKRSTADPAPAAAAPAAGPDVRSVQISGLSRLHQTALVLTDSCRTFKYETDRQDVARATINRTLESSANAMPGGLRLDVQSSSVRIRCHTAGLGAFRSYCVAEANLTLAASGRDRSGQEIALTASKETTERTDMGFLLGPLCADGMRAVTAAMDSALDGALADLQSGLANRTGVTAR